MGEQGLDLLAEGDTTKGWMVGDARTGLGRQMLQESEGVATQDGEVLDDGWPRPRALTTFRLWFGQELGIVFQDSSDQAGAMWQLESA